MENAAREEFTKHHEIVKALIDKLPSLIDDPDGHRLARVELKKHMAKLEKSCPPVTEPV